MKIAASLGIVCATILFTPQYLRGEVTATWSAEGRINSVVFSPDGKSLASASGTFVGLLQSPRAGQLGIWDISTGKLRVTLEGHSDGITSTAFLNGETLASGGYDSTVKLWNARTAQLLASIDPQVGAILSISVAPDKRRIVAGGWQGTQEGITNHFAVIDLLTHEVIAKVAAHSGAVTTAIFLSDNKVIVTGSDDGGVSLWKANDFTRLRTLSSYSGGVQCMALSPNGKTLAIASGDFASAADPTKAEGALGLWNTATWNEEVTMSRQEVVSAVAFSPDGNLLAVGGTEGLIRLVDIAGNELAVLRGYIGKVRSICFSPDGTILASGSSDGTIRLSRVPKLKDRPE